MVIFTQWEPGLERGGERWKAWRRFSGFSPQHPHETTRNQYLIIIIINHKSDEWKYFFFTCMKFSFPRPWAIAVVNGIKYNHHNFREPRFLEWFDELDMEHQQPILHLLYSKATYVNIYAWHPKIYFHISNSVSSVHTCFKSCGRGGAYRAIWCRDHWVHHCHRTVPL